MTHVNSTKISRDFDPLTHTHGETTLIIIIIRFTVLPKSMHTFRFTMEFCRQSQLQQQHQPWNEKILIFRFSLYPPLNSRINAFFLPGKGNAKQIEIVFIASGFKWNFRPPSGCEKILKKRSSEMMVTPWLCHRDINLKSVANCWWETMNQWWWRKKCKQNNYSNRMDVVSLKPLSKCVIQCPSPRERKQRRKNVIKYPR